MKRFFSDLKRTACNTRDLSRVIVDGLFLSYESVAKFLKELKNLDYLKYFNGVSIEYWTPDIENCLNNDKGRRGESSAVTIKNAKVDEVNDNYISRLETEFPELKQKIKYNNHKVYVKPDWMIKER